MAGPYPNAKLGVFDLCHFELLKRGCANAGVFGARHVQNRGSFGKTFEVSFVANIGEKMIGAGGFQSVTSLAGL